MTYKTAAKLFESIRFTTVLFALLIAEYNSRNSIFEYVESKLPDANKYYLAAASVIGVILASSLIALLISYFTSFIAQNILKLNLFSDIHSHVNLLKIKAERRVQPYWIEYIGSREREQKAGVKPSIPAKTTQVTIYSLMMGDLGILRSIFVNATGDNTISVSLYVPAAVRSQQIVMREEYHINSDGFDDLEGEKKIFYPREGVCGDSWSRHAVTIGRRYKFGVFENSRFKKFPRSDDNKANSVIVFPITTRNNEFCFAMLSIESSSQFTFDEILMKDTQYRAVVPKIAEIFAVYVLLLHRLQIRLLAPQLIAVAQNASRNAPSA